MSYGKKKFFLFDDFGSEVTILLGIKIMNE